MFDHPLDLEKLSRDEKLVFSVDEKKESFSSSFDLYTSLPFKSTSISRLYHQIWQFPFNSTNHNIILYHTGIEFTRWKEGRPVIFAESKTLEIVRFPQTQGVQRAWLRKQAMVIKHRKRRLLLPSCVGEGVDIPQAVPPTPIHPSRSCSRGRLSPVVLGSLVSSLYPFVLSGSYTFACVLCPIFVKCDWASSVLWRLA